MKITAVRKWLKVPSFQHQFAKNFIVLVSGTALGQLVTVLASPIITRLYSPEDFGVFGVYISILGIIAVVASLRYEYAIPLPQDDKTAANILFLCFLLLLGMVSIVSVITYVLGKNILHLLNIPQLGDYLWLIPAGVLVTGTYQILNYWAIRKGDFKMIARARISRGIGRVIIQVGAGFVNNSPLGLLLGQLAGEGVGSILLGVAAWKRDRSFFKTFSIQEMYKALARYKRFPLFSSLGGLLDTIGSSIPQILFAGFYGAEVAGWFAFGQSVIAAPLNIVVDSVAQVYFGEAVRVSKNDPKSMRQLFLRLTGRLALLGGLPILVVCALAPWFFAIIFDPNWEMAGRYVQILGFMFAARFAIVPLSHTLNILERQDLLFVWQGIWMLLSAGAIVGGKWAGLSHLGTVGVYSLLMTVAYIFLWIIIFVACASVLDQNKKNQQKGGKLR